MGQDQIDFVIQKFHYICVSGILCIYNLPYKHSIKHLLSLKKDPREMNFILVNKSFPLDFGNLLNFKLSMKLLFSKLDREAH